GPGSDGVNRHCTCFCDAMMRPMPAEMSQVSVPTLARWGACAEAGPARARPRPRAAAARMRRFMTKLLVLIHVAGGLTRGIRAGSGRAQTPRNVNGLWLLQAAAEALDAAARLLQRRGGGGVGDAERRPQPERGSLHHGHTLLLEELGHEILVGGERLAARRAPFHGAGARGIDVERAFGLGALDAVRLVEHGDAQVAPLLEHRVVPGD